MGGPVKPPAGRTQTPEPPVAKSAPSTPPTAPESTSTAGLTGFVKVKENAASGRKPTLDGFDSLKRMGYRTVVYLHAAGADVPAVRDVAEKRGLSLTAIETTPEKLSESIEAFNKVLADSSAAPVYVCDDDGLLAGVLWYVHLRTVDNQSVEVAKIRARALGLTEEGDEAKAFWVAIQRYLASR